MRKMFIPGYQQRTPGTRVEPAVGLEEGLRCIAIRFAIKCREQSSRWPTNRGE